MTKTVNNQETAEFLRAHDHYLILNHRPEYGGGEVWLDGELVRKDGLYVPKELQCLNPDQYFAD